MGMLHTVALVGCLLSVWATTPSKSQGEGGTIPTEHGLAAYEKNPTAAAEESPGMITFFGRRPKVELPEAQNVAKPVADDDPTLVQQQQHKTSSTSSSSSLPVIAGIVFALLGVGLLAAALLVAYMLHTRRSNNNNNMEWHPSGSSAIGLTTHWRRATGPEVL